MSNSSVRIAKWNALQAIVVAVVSSILTLATAAGVKFIDNSAETASLKKQLQDLQAEKDKAIEKLSGENTELRRTAGSVPAMVLYRATTQYSPGECLSRAIRVIEKVTGSAEGGGMERTTFDDASLYTSRPYMVRLLCDTATNSAIVAVGSPLSVSEVEKVAKAIKSAIE